MFFIILYHYENIGHYSLRCFLAFYLGVCVCKPGSHQPREREREGWAELACAGIDIADWSPPSKYPGSSHPVPVFSHPSLPSSVSCQVVVSGPLWPSVAQCGPGCKLLLTAMNDFIFMNGRAAVGSNTPLVCHNLPVPHEVVKFSSCLTADSKWGEGASGLWEQLSMKSVSYRIRNWLTCGTMGHCDSEWRKTWS